MSLNEDDLGGLDVRDGEKDADANAGHGPQNKGDGDRGNLDEDAPDAFRGDDVLAVFSGDAHGVILRGLGDGDAVEGARADQGTACCTAVMMPPCTVMVPLVVPPMPTV